MRAEELGKHRNEASQGPEGLITLVPGKYKIEESQNDRHYADAKHTYERARQRCDVEID